MEKRLLGFLRAIGDVAYLAATRSFQWPRRQRRPNDAGHFLTKYLMCFIGGCLASCLMLFLAKQRFIPPQKLLTIAFFLAPFLAACLFQEIGRYCRRIDASPCPRDYSLQVLWYCSGFALIKFFYFSDA